MKKGDANWGHSYKKDTNNLFTGGFKAEKFDTKIEKEERKRKSTKDWLNYSEEEEIDEEDFNS